MTGREGSNGLAGRRTTVVAWLLGCLGLTCSAAAFVFYGLGGHRVVVIYGNEIGITVGFCAVGALIAARVPRNAIGWLMLATGVVSAAGFVTLVCLGWLGHATVVGAPRWLTTFAEMTWMPGSITLFTLVPLLFPTGRPPSPRWRILVWTSAIGTAICIVGVATGTHRWVDFHTVNGLYHPAVAQVIFVGLPLVAGSVVGSIASVVVRYRRSHGALKEQLRWFVWAAVLATVAITPVLASGAHNAITIAVQFLAVVALPAAIGIAILRYHLYDIERVVSRSVTYALVTALLVAPYVVLTVAASRLARGSDVAVAALTLATLALLRPVRRRVQTRVDRRFNRQRYDAARTIDAFAGRLRDEVDPDTVREDLVAVTVVAMEPSVVSVWVT